MESQHLETEGTGALHPVMEQAVSVLRPPTEAQERRRSFRLVSFDDRHRQEAEDLAEMQEVVDANEEIDWQLRKWLRVQDELRNAIERERAAKEVREYYEQQSEQLSQFIQLECRDKYEELVAREKKGNSKYTDHPLVMANRRDLVVRVGFRSLPDLINIFDSELLINSAVKQGEETPPWLKWNPPVEGFFSIDKAALNKEVKACAKLPGIEIVEKPDQLYFQDKSRKDK